MVLDQLLGNIVASLIANGLSALVSYSLEKHKEIDKLRDRIKKNIESDKDLASTIHDAMEKVAKIADIPSNELQSTMIRLFLESPTAESIVRQIFSDFLPERIKKKSVTKLKEEFQICLAYHLGVNKNEVAELSKGLFEVIYMGCNKALNLVISKGILSAHEAKSIARHRVILDELQAIKNTLDFLNTSTSLDLKSIKDFEIKYRCQVGERSSQITVPHFDIAPRIDINKIFVSPNFIWTPIKKGAESETLTLNEFLNQLYRTVLLGDPGGGKSTLGQKICYELFKNYDKRLVGGRLLTPVLVILREYSSKKKKDYLSIVQFIESEVTSKYQIPKGPPPEAFEYLLHNGHILVIFDGLDELLDPSHRRDISNDIESFCTLFPSAPVLVTSRVVGYEQAPLDQKRFEIFHIAPFDDEQVSEYANKWFSNDPSLTPDECERRANAFIEESEFVSDLRSNPLMLALMCNLYRGAGYIPRNRPEVYKKCSEMLFERWDPSRGIWVHLPITEPKVLLSHLAHWIYSDESLQSGVSEDQLIKESTNFLCPRRFETEEEAEKASRDFIEFCRHRAWVFTDVGTTPKGANIYKFTHKTFLEYFTAAHIVRNNITPEKLWQLLKPRIAERAWDVVAQLSFQMLHEQVEGGSDKLLAILINDAQNNKANQWAYLSFAARCLQFIQPTPKTIRALTETSARYVLGNASISYINKALLRKFFSRMARNADLIMALESTAPECRPIVADSLHTEIVNYANNADDKLALRAIDLGLTLKFAFLIRPKFEFERDLLEYWDTVEIRIFEQINEKLKYLASNNFLAFIYWLYRGEGSIEKLFEWYTPDHLLSPINHIVFPHNEPPIAKRILDICEFDVCPEKIIKMTSKLGEIFISRPLPCFSIKKAEKSYKRDIHYYPYYRYRFGLNLMSMRDFREEFPIQGYALFGVLCLWLLHFEQLREKYGKELIRYLRNHRNKTLGVFSYAIESRMQKMSPKKALKKLKTLNLPSISLQFIERWITGEISFNRP